VKVVEKVLYPSDIKGASRIFIGNDARGLMEAELRPGSNGGRSLRGVKGLK